MSTNEYKNAFNNNIDDNVAICKRRPIPVIKQFLKRNKIHVVFPNKVKILIPGYTKYNEAVRFDRKTCVLGTSVVKGIRRN